MQESLIQAEPDYEQDYDALPYELVLPRRAYSCDDLLENLTAF